jgi:hypothetical protein
MVEGLYGNCGKPVADINHIVYHSQKEPLCIHRLPRHSELPKNQRMNYIRFPLHLA